MSASPLNSYPVSHDMAAYSPAIEISPFAIVGSGHAETKQGTLRQQNSILLANFLNYDFYLLSNFEMEVKDGFKKSLMF